MAEVLAAPALLEGGYYRTSSPRCSSPQPSYKASTPRTATFERNFPQDPREPYTLYPRRSSPQPPSSRSSSPGLSSVVTSTQSSSTTSSVASSICLEDTKDFKNDDPLVFPVYEYQSPSTSLYVEESAHATESGDGDSAETREGLRIPDIEVTLALPTAADDYFIRHEPTRHVDYLSHDWKEEDIWASWRYMVAKRDVHTNGARLENASWRTWAKAKNNLKTVSPEKLNWLKDCDVTWLYGPLCSGPGRLSAISPYSPPASPAESKSQLSHTCKTKPILKKRSMSELMLRRSLTSSSLLKQATAALESQQANATRKPTRPVVTRAQSDVTSFPSSASRSTTIVTGTEITSRLSTGTQSPTFKRHIHFNDRVQQCIAVDKDDDEVDHDDDYFSSRYADSSPSEDDDKLAMTRGPGRSRSRDRRGSTEPQTIAMLPSTTLKYVEEPPPKKPPSFNPFNSFFSSANNSSSVSPPTATTKSYLLADDEELADLDWVPKSGFAGQNDTSASRGTLSSDDLFDSDLQLPNYSYGEDDEAAAAGLIGRAVDAVNTARDIAHVLWNVGWRR